MCEINEVAKLSIQEIGRESYCKDNQIKRCSRLLRCQNREVSLYSYIVVMASQKSCQILVCIAIVIYIATLCITYVL